VSGGPRTPATLRRMRWTVAVNIGLLVIVLTVTLIALYLPVFVLGQVV
jgi:hypothetical protein